MYLIQAHVSCTDHCSITSALTFAGAISCKLKLVGARLTRRDIRSWARSRNPMRRRGATGAMGAGIAIAASGGGVRGTVFVAAICFCSLSWASSLRIRSCAAASSFSRAISRAMEFISFWMSSPITISGSLGSTRRDHMYMSLSSSTTASFRNQFRICEFPSIREYSPETQYETSNMTSESRTRLLKLTSPSTMLGFPSLKNVRSFWWQPR
mmetsp:Transcript_29039/g.81241  ORF Transcript_29039/g.81241 Transcript_29039/m.81241 type:complete len:211 (+) Transcript_29039:651-1283(+)